MRVLRRTGIVAANVPSSPEVAFATVTHAPLGPVIWIETLAFATGAPSAPASVPDTPAPAGSATRAALATSVSAGRVATGLGPPRARWASLARVRISGICAYSALPGHSVLSPSR